MEKYKEIEHTADLELKIYGKDKKELFKNALLALNNKLEPKTKEEKTKRIIKVESEDLSTLLVDFLNEVISLGAVKNETYNEIKFIDFTDKRLEVKLKGKKVKSFRNEIKATSYHKAEIKKKEKRYQINIIFDI